MSRRQVFVRPMGAARQYLPLHVPSGAVLLALALSQQARGVRGLDVLRRSIDRAPPLPS